MGQEQFISEPLQPDAGSADLAAMSRGEPGLPQGFNWRGRHYRLEKLLGFWKTDSSGEGTGDQQVYLRRHWYRVRLEGGSVATIYCLRQAPAGKKKTHRWWIYSIEDQPLCS